MSCESFLMCNAGMIFGIIFGVWISMVGSIIFAMLGYCVYTCYISNQRYYSSMWSVPYIDIDLSSKFKNKLDDEKHGNMLQAARDIEKMIYARIDEAKKPVITVACPLSEEEDKKNIEAGKKVGMVFPRQHEIDVCYALLKTIKEDAIDPLRSKLGYDN